MLTLAQIKEVLRNGPYAWPGGYPVFFVCADGEALSFKAVRENWKEICRAHIEPRYRDQQWTLVAYDINWEDSALYCAHTNERIESAYAEDKALV